jgi:hypothetical protein
MRSNLRSRWVKIGVPVAVVAAGFATAQIAGAGSASAAVAPVTVTATSALNTSVQKSVSATCPAGRAAVGVAASTSRQSAVHIIGLVPNGRTATATARVFAGSGFRWTVTVKAICAVRPAGLQYVSVTSTTPVFPGSETVGAQTPCPGVKRLIGFGGAVAGGRIVSFMPQNDPANAIFLSGQPFPGTVGPLTVRAVAVCANPGFVSQYPEPPLTTSDGQPVNSTASCPANLNVYAVAGWVVDGGSYLSNVAVNGPVTAASFTLRSSLNEPFSGKVIPFCVD